MDWYRSFIDNIWSDVFIILAPILVILCLLGIVFCIYELVHSIREQHKGNSKNQMKQEKPKE